MVQSIGKNKQFIDRNCLFHLISKGPLNRNQGPRSTDMTPGVAIDRPKSENKTENIFSGFNSFDLQHLNKERSNTYRLQLSSRKPSRHTYIIRRFADESEI